LYIGVRENWEEHLSLVEFIYNNNYQSMIKITPYEALYGKKNIEPLFVERKLVIGS